MFRAFKCNQWLIQTISLPVSSRCAPTIFVTGEPKNDFMTAQILSSLISIPATRSRCADERQPQSSVIRLIRTVFAIGEYRGAVHSGLVRQVDPLMRRDFELPLFGVRSLHRADVPVISGQVVSGGERKGGFQIGFFGLPVNDVAKFDAIAGVTGRQTNRLHKG